MASQSNHKVHLHRVVEKTKDFVLGTGDSPEDTPRPCFLLVNTRYQVVEAWGFSESMARMSMQAVQSATEEARATSRGTSHTAPPGLN